MPNKLDAQGLQLNTRDEWVAYFTAGYEKIYGTGINLASDTPDGQWMNLAVQALVDNGDLWMQVFNGMDPDNAIGVVLDQRVAINGIERQAGTYTVTPITLVNNRSINIYGLDQADDPEPEPVYTIQDNAGNKWFLITTQEGLGAGSHVLSFRAAVPGVQLTTPNTIQTPVTIILGVVSVNNPTVYTSLGVNEESDAVLKVRRRRSVSNASQGFLPGLYGTLTNLPGMESAFIFENDTDVTEDGTPAHSIWVITAGSADPEQIADAIYRKRNAGCGMRGDQTFNILQVDGTLFEIRWDESQPQTLFIFVELEPIISGVALNIGAIRSGLPALIHPAINQSFNVTTLGTLIQSIDPNAVIKGGTAGLGYGITQDFIGSGVPASGGLKFRYKGALSAVVNWNDNNATITGKIQAISNVSVFIFGTLNGTLTIINTADADPELFSITQNTVQTSAPAAVTYAFTPQVADILYPSTPQDQFSLIEAHVVIYPIQILPIGVSLASAENTQFFAYGGYGAYAWSLSVNNSGGSINASSGIYTAGPTPGTDTVKVLDEEGQFSVIAVTVV